MPITYDRKDVFDGLAKAPFGRALSANQRTGADAILTGWERLQPAGDTRLIAYCLATCWWETAGTMQPIEEYGKGRGRAYGVPTGPWHQVYDGRGDVQLTWQANYRKATKRLRELGVIGSDIDLERTPTLALRPDIAAATMFYGMLEGWFTGRKLADYFNGARTDWVGARRIINGTDHDADIARAAQAIFAVLRHALVFTDIVAKAVPAPPIVVLPPIAPSLPVPPPAVSTAATPASHPAVIAAPSTLARLLDVIISLVFGRR